MQVLDKPKMMYAPDEMDDLLNGQHFINLNKYSFLYREASGAPCMMGFIDNEATTYTAKDYENLPEDAPYQLIDGNLIFMFSPTRIHQKVLGHLYRILTAHCEKEQLGEVYFAPLDVRFSEYNILQPDLIFVSNARKHILQERINGAPDFVVEILSKNRKYDLGKKKEIYGRFGVLEYWTIDPEEKTVTIWENENGQMVETTTSNEQAKSKTVAGFSVRLADIF